MFRKTSLLFTFLFLLTLPSCEEGLRNEQKQVMDVEGEKVELSHARGFEVLKYPGYFEITIKDPFSDNIIQTFSFSETNEEDIDFSVCERIACLSTTHASILASVQATKKIEGLAYADRVKDERVLECLKNGNIRPLAGEGEVDQEKLLAIAPDVFFIYPYDMDDALKYEELGIPYIQIAEYLEPHPLGRAEWMKLFGLLTGNLEIAQKEFKKIEDSYNLAKTKAMLYSELPTVFTGSFYQGKWYAPSGESFVANFIRDAAALYVFSDENGADNIELEMEKMIEKAHNADYWGKVIFSDEMPTKTSFVEEDERLNAFKAFREGQLFICNAAQSDYFGKGIVEPHMMLRDLIEIFHPGTFPKHQVKYFKALEQ